MLRNFTPKKFDSGFNRSNVLLFSVLMLLQFVVISLFQAKISIRDYALNEPLNLIYDQCSSFKFAYNRNHFIYYVVENYLFIAYQLFLMYLGLTALFDQYVLQICIYSIMNFGGYIYLIVQMIEVKSSTDFAREDCLKQETTQEAAEGLSEITINPKIIQNELPQFILYTFFVIFTGFLSLNLFLQSGINNYFQKKVGDNELFISLLKRRHFFKLLLKTFTFFSIIYLVFSIYFFLSFLARKETLMAIGTAIFLIFFIFALRLTRMTFISVDNELNEGMLYFTYLWNFVLLNNICFCLIGIYFIYDRWYFLFPYNFVYFVVALLSYLCALDIKKDFGKGLNEAMENHKIELQQLSKFQSILNNGTEEIMIVNSNIVNDIENANNNS